ncbi:carboxymuconolactone decarboxylase family protein [Amycolatopsis sp.]|uniref:carboxymuconolactone decarboxylase family protein n=1 Tax=Amycolatopsis sp. TaxID=37632 RepID=UPI002C67541D|nr:carboxymuconolactone decarboxylase family protein [Amycolatopsis sp.]HVV10592.1 carboxymuconolactone decarboxylase family protein [Amycolatopsis sp.]
METRLNPLTTEVGPKLVKHILSAHKAVAASPLPAATLELVNIRASQINGCGGCLDMHTKEALHAGETAVRVNLVAAWRDVNVFTEAEKAALELTEHGTRLADSGGVGDEVWANAAKHYDDEQLMALVAQIALINAFNRMNVLTRQQGGDYTPGQFTHERGKSFT